MKDKVKNIDKNDRFLLFFRDKSMRFIVRKHAFRWIKAMLLSGKSIEFIRRKNNKNCNTLIINALQNRSFSHYFQEKNFSWKITQRKC